MKKIVAGLTLFGALSFAATLDGIAVLVNDKVVTMYEIVKLAEEKKLSREEAIDLLVQKRLEEIELNKKDVKIDDFEVDKQVEKVASNNGFTLTQFKDALRQRVVDFEDYKKDVKQKMTRDKLYQKIAYQKYVPIDEKEIVAYFEANKKLFTAPKKLVAIEYSSVSREAVEAAIVSPLAKTKNVKKSEITIEMAGLEPGLIYLFKETKEGQFTAPMNAKGQFISYFIKEKLDSEQLPLEKVRNEIFERLAQQKEESAIKEYFEKLKASAKIKVVRLPN
jgi:peptidyl-prolyl cis-trans isomerase SurA